MGIQINGNTDNITATDGGLSITSLEINQTGISTFQAGVNVSGGDVSIIDKIVHTGDTNTAIRFPAADTITAETGGSERLRIDSNGLIANNARVPSSFGSPNLLISGTDSTFTLMGDGSTNGSSFTGIKFRVAGGSAGDYTKAGIFSRREGGYNDLSLIFALDAVADATSVSIADEKMRIHSGGQVSIGSATEGHADADELTLAGTRTGLTIRSASDNYGNIFFSDATSGADEYVGAVQYYHADNSLRFKTNSTDRLLISSSGGTAIFKSGTIHADSGWAGLEVRASSSEHQLVLSSSSNAANSNYSRLGFKLHPSYQNERIKAAIVCQGSGGGYGEVDRMMFCLDNVGDNGNADGNGADERFRIDNSGNATVMDGDLVIGTSGHGIDFSASGHAGGMTSELLDDYEEGSFTATIAQGGTASSFTHNKCSYTKIGRFVHFQMYLMINGSGNGSLLQIGGLPFTAVPYAKGYGGAYVAYQNNVFQRSGDLVIYVPQNTSNIAFYNNSGSQYAGNAGAVFANRDFIIVGSYITDS